MKPTNALTQGQPNPSVWATYSQSKILFRGLGLYTEHRPEETQPDQTIRQHAIDAQAVFVFGFRMLLQYL